MDNSIEVSRKDGEYCFFCMREIPLDIDAVGVLTSWGNGQRLTYCREHYRQVVKFQEKQLRLYEKSKWRSQEGG